MAHTVADAQRQTVAALTPGPIVELKAGRIERTGSTWRVTVGTKPVQAIWAEHITPRDGAACLLGMSTLPGGQSTGWLLAVTSSTPAPPATGTVIVANAGATSITVDTGNGGSVTAVIAAPYAPAVGDVCLLDTRGGVIYATGRALVTPATAPAASNSNPMPAPPAPAVTGTSDFRAQDSGTYTAAAGGWNAYFGQNVYSGSGYIPVSTGHWFYNGSTRAMAGKTVGAVRFYLGPRQKGGAYDQPATIHFYTHSSDSRASTEPVRGGTAFDFTVPKDWGGGWVTLPQSFGVALQGGGGISIAGDPYAGFASGAETPLCGALSFDWSN